MDSLVDRISGLVKKCVYSENIIMYVIICTVYEYKICEKIKRGSRRSRAHVTQCTC